MTKKVATKFHRRSLQRVRKHSALVCYSLWFRGISKWSRRNFTNSCVFCLL